MRKLPDPVEDTYKLAESRTAVQKLHFLATYAFR